MKLIPFRPVKNDLYFFRTFCAHSWDVTSGVCAYIKARECVCMHKRTQNHTHGPPARGRLVKLKGASAFPSTSRIILIKRLVSEAPPGVAGDDRRRRARRRDGGDERSSPAERLGAYLESRARRERGTQRALKTEG